MESEENLVGVLKTLYSHRKYLMWITLLAFFGSIILSLLLPVYYKSSTIFYSGSTDLSKPDVLFGNNNSYYSYYGTEEDIDRLLAIADSEELKKHLIDKYDLYNRYDIDKNKPQSPYFVRRKLSKLMQVQRTKLGAISISVEDRDAAIAMDIANDARIKINDMAGNLIKVSQQRITETYHSNLENVSEELQTISDSLLLVRSKYGIIDASGQSEVFANLIGKAASNLSRVRGRLIRMRNNTSVHPDSISRLEADMSGFETELKNLQKGSSSTSLSAFNKGISSFEMLSDQLQRLSSQYTTARVKLNELNAAIQTKISAIHLIEPAHKPVIKSRPVRKLIVLSSTFAAILLSILGILIWEGAKDIDWKDA